VVAAHRVDGEANTSNRRRGGNRLDAHAGMLTPELSTRRDRPAVPGPPPGARDYWAGG
jgi:hypothetical protein